MITSHLICNERIAELEAELAALKTEAAFWKWLWDCYSEGSPDPMWIAHMRERFEREQT